MMDSIIVNILLTVAIATIAELLKRFLPAKLSKEKFIIRTSTGTDKRIEINPMMTESEIEEVVRQAIPLLHDDYFSFFTEQVELQRRYLKNIKLLALVVVVCTIVFIYTASMAELPMSLGFRMNVAALVLCALVYLVIQMLKRKHDIMLYETLASFSASSKFSKDRLYHMLAYYIKEKNVYGIK